MINIIDDSLLPVENNEKIRKLFDDICANYDPPALGYNPRCSVYIASDHILHDKENRVDGCC